MYVVVCVLVCLFEKHEQSTLLGLFEPTALLFTCADPPPVTCEVREGEPTPCGSPVRSGLAITHGSCGRCSHTQAARLPHDCVTHPTLS